MIVLSVNYFPPLSFPFFEATVSQNKMMDWDHHPAES
jgi:hypothetical protein